MHSQVVFIKLRHAQGRRKILHARLHLCVGLMQGGSRTGEMNEKWMFWRHAQLSNSGEQHRRLLLQQLEAA
jgi:hypothetical protein